MTGLKLSLIPFETQVYGRRLHRECFVSSWLLTCAPRHPPSSLVVVEGDPKPGALLGRMSFKSYNPVIEV